MNRKMKSVRVCFLILVLLEAMWCEGCWKEERQALFGLHSRFHSSNSPFSWNVHTDCCEWEGVLCNSSTGRVTRLELDLWNSMEEYINYSDFSVFKDLKVLELSYGGIVGCVGDEDLPNLEVLLMSGNKLDTAAGILSCLDGLPSLKSLYLRDNRFNTFSLNHAFESASSKLRNLEVLDISFNDLTNDILPSLEGFTSLKELYLAGTQLDSDLHIEALCSTLKNLEVLDLSSNNFNQSDIASALSGLSSLNSLYLEDSELSWRSIFNISKLSSLEILHLGWNWLNESERGSENGGFKWPINLEKLWLTSNGLSNKFVSTLSGLPRLKLLDLSNNQLEGALDIKDNDGFKWPANLEDLWLNSNRLSNKILPSISGLPHLQSLYLSGNQLQGALNISDWFKLKNLEELDLSHNLFMGSLPSSFLNMTSLWKLELSQNHLSGDFYSNMASLPSLEYFGFEENQFVVPISFAPFANNSNLKFIYGKGNKVILDSQPSLQTWIPKFQLKELSLSSTTNSDSLPLPRFLLYQNDLTGLDFSSLKLEGGFPRWLLENNTKLMEVIFRNCSLIGTMQLPLRPLPELFSIDVSYNTIIGEIPNKNMSSIYPNLEHLNMSRNHIHGSIPRDLGRMKSLLELDLSNNQLSGEISEDIFEAKHKLTTLILSNNKLEGPIFTVPTNMELLSLKDNNFSGRLPSSIFNTSIISLDLSNNHLVGKIPSLIKNLSRLSEFCMSNNHLEGFIPLELAQLEDLSYLDLSQNNLTGLVPSFLNSFVKFIHLNNNHLTGLSRKMFKESSPLVMLDLSYNKISNNIQDMIQDLSYSKLNFLLLKDNQISGDIPKQLCLLKDLTMLDISYNKFSGEIPHCLGTMPFDNNNLDPSLKVSKVSFVRDSPNNSSISQHEKASFTTKKRIDTYTGSILAYMSGIDLSHNKLKGSIPYELGNLTRILVLNLSHNDLTGQIPDSFSNLVQTESLDLSFNKLSGQIPPELNILTSLEVFSVAYNNLSGPIPKQTNQFGTFDESSYEGNPFLCGSPLLKSCGPDSTIILNDSDTHKDNDCLVDMYVFCVSFVVSYTLALLATAVALYVNPYWRQAWFYYIELVSLNCYYFVVDNFCRFCIARNM